MQNIQILILGKSHEHILKVIDHYKPNFIFFISSYSLEYISREFMIQIQSKGIKCELNLIDAFSEDTILNILGLIGSIIRKYKDFDHLINIFIGLTGGTNLMAIGAGLAAHKYNLNAHYVDKESDRLLNMKLNDISEY